MAYKSWPEQAEHRDHTCSSAAFVWKNLQTTTKQTNWSPKGGFSRGILVMVRPGNHNFKLKIKSKKKMKQPKLFSSQYLKDPTQSLQILLALMIWSPCSAEASIKFKNSYPLEAFKLKFPSCVTKVQTVTKWISPLLMRLWLWKTSKWFTQRRLFRLHLHTSPLMLVSPNAILP